MLRHFTLRRAGLVGVLLATQLLAACVVVPRPYYRSHAVEPGWRDHDRRDDRRWRDDDRRWRDDDRRWQDRRDRPDWDGR